MNDDAEEEHEQRVREDRADDRGLSDHELAGRERKEHDEELGQVPECRLHDPGHGRAEALADLLGRERGQPGGPASASVERMNVRSVVAWA